VRPPFLLISFSFSHPTYPQYASAVILNSCIDRLAHRKRVEVIADDEAQIIEASRRMVQNYDFVVTSGGIGPTHDGSFLIPSP
jgi:molybdopterin biosynthesis enzyme MoaB